MSDKTIKKISNNWEWEGYGPLNILLTIPDKDCLHSSLVTGPVPRFVLGPVSGAVPTGTVLGVAPGQATAPPVLSFPMLKNRIVIY